MTDFLGMPSVYSDQAATTPQYMIIHNILRGQYVPPKNATANTPKAQNSPKKTMVSFFKRSSTGNGTSNNSIPRPASVSSTNGVTTTNNNNTTITNGIASTTNATNTINNGTTTTTTNTTQNALATQNSTTSVAMTENKAFDNRSSVGSSSNNTNTNSQSVVARPKIDSDNASVFSGNDVMSGNLLIMDTSLVWVHVFLKSLHVWAVITTHVLFFLIELRYYRYV